MKMSAPCAKIDEEDDGARLGNVGILLSDEWSHQNKEWQITLDLARKFGWSSVENSNHGGLNLMCPEGVHEFPIYSTGRSTENVARTKRRVIRSCQHRNITEPLDQVEEWLDSAERLLSAAGQLMSRSEAENRMEEALEMLGLAENNLTQAEAAFDTAAQELDRAIEALDDMPPSVISSGASSLVGDAASQIREATLALRDLPEGHERVIFLREQASDLRNRALALKARLSS